MMRLHYRRPGVDVTGIAASRAVICRRDGDALPLRGGVTTPAGFVVLMA